MRLTLGYSPCPNDTFIFWALAKALVAAPSLSLSPVVRDVQALNELCLSGRLDVSKVSCHAMAFLAPRYAVLAAGAAMGRGVGPILVARRPFALEELSRKTVAAPGALTTAHLLLLLREPGLKGRVVQMSFQEVLKAVASGQVDAGVLIHEGRFVYEAHGLLCLLDLGQWWEAHTGLPLPLGGLVARRRLGKGLLRELEELVRRSILYAWAHPEEAMPYVRQHAQELKEDVLRRHIELYVNGYSVQMGPEGQEALRELLRRAHEAGLCPAFREPLFAE